MPRRTLCPQPAVVDRYRHHHAVTIRPAGPDQGRHHDQWWIRDFGCDITYLQPGPSPEPWIPARPERRAS